MIQIEHLRKTYDGVNYILDDVNVNIAQGEYVQIIGDSGSGKSTLLNLIGMLDNKFEGKLYVKDKDISKLNDTGISLMRAETIGFIFQSYNLIYNLTASENILLPILYSRKKLDNVITERANELIERFGIEKIKDKPIQLLSGGEKQRVAFARALMLDPDIILADEPTGNLDKKNSEMIFSTLKKLSKDGKTVILVTHNWFDENGADRTYNVKGGKII